MFLRKKFFKTLYFLYFGGDYGGEKTENKLYS